ncbi:MAG: zf-HC2 domain-containing protein [Lachnospiraceae bacterium]|nr:zf-HC2 domain-containing protein [Lachnospiraceae bacterium]
MSSKEDTISCKDVEGFFQPYLERSLSSRDTKLLLTHLKDCSECMDELEVRYLLHEGLKSLEDGHNFNLKEELKERLYQSEQHVLMIDRLKTSIVLLSGALLILGAVQLIMTITG